MTTTISRPCRQPLRAMPRRRRPADRNGGPPHADRAGETSPSRELDGELLARYIDGFGCPREILKCEGASGSSLIIDRSRRNRGDRRLVAHLAADEPAGNAAIVCNLYMRDASPRPCRRVTPEDLDQPAPTELEGQSSTHPEPSGSSACRDLQDAAGNVYRLSPAPARLSIPELRWLKQGAPKASTSQPISVRDLIGTIESYEPVRALSAAAIRRHRNDRGLSVSTLAAELERVNASRTVLNRGLREAVLAKVEQTDLSMSEIALRCGRVKRDPRGMLSGETTWLARRLGLVCEGGSPRPSPWIHTEVLALIARRGLCMAPREVELT